MSEGIVKATEKRLMKVFGFSERKVRTYFKEARIEAGIYNFVLAVEIYLKNSSGKDEELELKKIEKETKKFNLDIKKGKYHLEDDVILLVSDMLARFKSKLTCLPAKISIDLLNKTNRREIEDILKKEINQTLLELSGYKELKMEGLDGAEDD